MLVKTVKLSSKGQLSVPVDALRALKLRPGAEFVLIQDGDRIILIPAADVAKQLLDDTKDFHALGETAFKGVWDNSKDEIWNEV